VPKNEIEKNDYNIGVSSYVIREDTREEINIIKLNADITQIVIHQDKLRKAIDEIVANLEGGEA
ncbi:MAG TPA: type I restriction-modification system subunit M, partial [bacterium]|nr:type I restriction-modification system subunit M [bacterium]